MREGARDSHRLRRVTIAALATVAAIPGTAELRYAQGQQDINPTVAAIEGADHFRQFPPPSAAPRPVANPLPGRKYAQTPDMGWNSYYSIGPYPNESRILQQAELLHSGGLETTGYRWIWIDAGWWSGARDSHGNISVDPTLWPHGMKWLTDRLHELGFRAGIYTDAGYWGCGGRNQGSFGHFQQDADKFAQWGFDGLKIDYCGGRFLHRDPRKLYTDFSNALNHNSSHRPMFIDICNPFKKGNHVGQVPTFAESFVASYAFAPRLAEAWRTGEDVASFNRGYAKWADILRNIKEDAAHPGATGPGHWSEPDDLVPGLLNNATEFRAQMSMWAVLAAPLLFGQDMSQISPATMRTLRTKRVLAVDQDRLGIRGTLVAKLGRAEVWVKPLANGERAVVFFNGGNKKVFFRQTPGNVGMATTATRYEVKNLWSGRKDITDGVIGSYVAPRSANMYEVKAL